MGDRPHRLDELISAALAAQYGRANNSVDRPRSKNSLIAATARLAKER